MMKKLRTYLILMTVAIGGIFYLIINEFDSYIDVLFQHIEIISTIIATFSFTMAGFLATILTFIFGISETATFKKYKEYGHFSNTLFYYFFSLVCLFTTYIMSFFSFEHKTIFKIMISSSILNICQILFVTFIVYKLVNKAGTS